MKYLWIMSLAAMLLTACGERAEYRTLSGAVWGTTYHITYRSKQDLSDSVFSQMNRIDEALSMFNKASSVSKINANVEMVPDREIVELWQIAARVNQMSKGAFDPTVAPLVDLWGFGRRGRDVPAPDSASVMEALRGVGMSRWVVEAGSPVVKPTPEAALDFSAIAKGYGVDCIARMLERNGCRDFMVEVGGEIALRGVNPRGKQWRISIDAPVDTLPGSMAAGHIDTTDCAIATSGNYRNYHTDSTGAAYGHIIDPKTGYPRSKAFRSVTVVASTCALADALATAMMAADPALSDSIISKSGAKFFIVK